jgi:hypothetical protein
VCSNALHPAYGINDESMATACVYIARQMVMHFIIRVYLTLRSANGSRAADG